MREKGPRKENLHAGKYLGSSCQISRRERYQQWHFDQGSQSDSEKQEGPGILNGQTRRNEQEHLLHARNPQRCKVQLAGHSQMWSEQRKRCEISLEGSAIHWRQWECNCGKRSDLASCKRKMQPEQRDMQWKDTQE